MEEVSIWGVSMGNQALKCRAVLFVQAYQHRGLCTPQSVWLPFYSWEDLEREMVSSRLLLIARRCASRCNRIPAATWGGGGSRSVGLCVWVCGVFTQQPSLLGSNNSTNRLALNVVSLRRHRPSGFTLSLCGQLRLCPKCQGYLLDFLTDRAAQPTWHFSLLLLSLLTQGSLLLGGAVTKFCPKSFYFYLSTSLIIKSVYN